MRFVLFYHSLASDWNHGNAHFLRGVMRQLLRMGHSVKVHEMRDNWSRWNLEREHGSDAADAYRIAYPELSSTLYDLDTLNLDDLLSQADVVLVHEFNPPELVSRIGEHHRTHRHYRLLFHDTHHRAVTAPDELGRYDLTHYDGTLVFGDVLRELYLHRQWARQAWTWHEAADVTVFHPLSHQDDPAYDLVWIGNWGDEERTEELHEFLLEPVARLGLRAKVWGVRYPDEGLAALERAGIEYGGYLPNHLVPAAFASARVTVHVPRRPYAEALPGVPTIRPFEAMACGIPLISAPWRDTENLFSLGDDYLMVRDGHEMATALKLVLRDRNLATDLARHARQTIVQRHTCRHRAEQLMRILGDLPTEETRPPSPLASLEPSTL